MLFLLGYAHLGAAVAFEQRGRHTPIPKIAGHTCPGLRALAGPGATASLRIDLCRGSAATELAKWEEFADCDGSTEGEGVHLPR